MLKLVGVPLFDLPILARREEQMGLGDKLEKHDAEADDGEIEREGRGGEDEERLRGIKKKIQSRHNKIEGKQWMRKW